MEKSENGSVQSVMRALDIVDVLSNSEESLGVTQIANLAGLSKTTTFRLLGTLISAGYVQKIQDQNDYQLSMKFLKISDLILKRLDIREVAKPFIKNLSNSTKEIVHLAIMDGNEIVYIDKMEGSEHPMRIFSNVGKHTPIHCTGLGKVFLSELPDDEVEKIVAQKGLKKYTENTITDMGELKTELAAIKERGYAFDKMEHEIGIWCVAAPVFDRKKKIAAAISITAPEIYMSEQKTALLLKEVVNSAKCISFQLGYTSAEK